MKDEDKKAEANLRRKIALLNTFKDNSNSSNRNLVIERYKHLFPADKNVIEFLIDFNSKDSRHTLDDLNDWIRGMVLEANQIKVKL